MNLSSKITSVCFTGHRDLSVSEVKMIRVKLAHLLSLLADAHSLSDCFAGGAIGLDTVASQVVLKLKEDHPSLRLNLILPCNGQDSKWNSEQKKTYNEIKEKADSVRVLSPFFYNGCMQARNKELLLSSDLCIAYLRNGTCSGGSLNTVIQATKMGIPVINLADPESEYIYEISK
jgi:uncharacterized phage-like protein YoqJ